MVAIYLPAPLPSYIKTIYINVLELKGGIYVWARNKHYRTPNTMELKINVANVKCESGLSCKFNQIDVRNKEKEGVASCKETYHHHFRPCS